MLKRTIILFAVLTIPIFTHADTIVVPDDYPTIQGAIDAAVNGDTVLVKPGTYVENIDFLGKAIAVTSSHGPESTIIDGGQPAIPDRASVAVFLSGEGPDSVLDGFTLTNGIGSKYSGGLYRKGGGIMCSSSPTIMNNIIKGNSAEYAGGGISCAGNSPPTLINNLITRNTCYGSSEGGGGLHAHCFPPALLIQCTISKNTAPKGGGISSDYGNTELVDCVVVDNEAGVGGGAYLYEFGDIDADNCIFAGNTASSKGGGVWLCDGTTLTLENCTFYGNYAEFGSGIFNGGMYLDVVNSIIWECDILTMPGSMVSVGYSCVQGGHPGTGNIGYNPLLVDQWGRDFHLTYVSPCRNAGSNSSVSKPEDFEGDPRIVDSVVDMGADEFYTHLYVTGDKTPGGAIQGKFVGLPGTNPVGLFIGSGILPSPMPTMWGEYWLQAPYVLLGPLGSIPSNGVMVLPTTIPPGMTAPVDIPMQALIGLNADSLTNLEVLEVR